MHEVWRDHAACCGLPPEIFYPEPDGEDPLGISAKWVCISCPVQADCLDYAVRMGEDHGIWGGVGQEWRRELAGVLLLDDVFAYSEAIEAATHAVRVQLGEIPDDRPELPGGICPLCGDPIRPGRLPRKIPGPGRTCGKSSTYNDGCRCDRCVRAKVADVAGQAARRRGDVPARGALVSEAPTLQPTGAPSPMSADTAETTAKDTEIDKAEVDARIKELEGELALLEVELEANDRLSLAMFPEEIFRGRALDTSHLDPNDPQGFAKLMMVLQKIEDGVQFWLGDAMQWGEAAFDAQVWAVVTSRVKFKTLMNYRRICEILDPSERMEDVDWGVHRVIAESFPKVKKERKRALSRAVKGEWGYSQAATYCRERKAELAGDIGPQTAEEAAEIEEPDARAGDDTVAPVEEGRVVWAIRVDVDPDESSAAQEVVSLGKEELEALLHNSGIASARVEIVYSGAAS